MLVYEEAAVVGSVILSILISLCSCYPFGAGLSACKTLIPGHGKEPQPPTTLPYQIEPESDTFFPNRLFKVRIRTAVGSSKHRKIGGFLVQARAPGSTEPLGRWEVDNGDGIKLGMKTQNCSRFFDSITHSDSKPKNADIILHFFPTNDMPDQIQFVGTVAANWGTFWTNIHSSIVSKRIVHHHHHDHHSTVATFVLETPATTLSTPVTSIPRRIHHHVTQQRPVQHHPRRTTTTTTTPKPPVTVAVKADDSSDYEKEQEMGQRNVIERTKVVDKDDEDKDRIQNDGNTNTDPLSSKLANGSPARARANILQISQLVFCIYCGHLLNI